MVEEMGGWLNYSLAPQWFIDLVMMKMEGESAAARINSIKME